MSALRFLARVSFLVATIIPCGRPLAAAPGVPPRRTSVAQDGALNPFDRSVIERVRVRAAARLAKPQCREILTEFKDRSGRTLQSSLESLGVSASRYLLEIAFVDGTWLPRCRQLEVMMATTPGVPRVFVCPAAAGQVNSRLSRIELLSGSLAEAMVIHEMLHTLGLGENPPSTFEITERVRDQCR